MKPFTERLFREMADLTAPVCANKDGRGCLVPHSCCDPMYCDLTQEYAASQGVALEPTGHPKLKFMGPSGCTVAPHLRPMCTLHVCCINSLGCKPGDPAFTQKYFKLREEIDAAMWAEGQAHGHD